MIHRWTTTIWHEGGTALILTALLLLLTSRFAFGQLPPLEGWTSHTWNIADGLPDQSIEAVAQTPDGYLWLGTPHGLARYDGFGFEVTADRTHGMLREFGVSCLLVAKDGELWVGSIGGGITRISHNQVGVGYEPGSEGLTVRALYQDENATVWAATGHGLFRFDGNRFVQYGPLGDQVLTSISTDRSGGMWLAGAKLFHVSGGKVSNIPLPYRSTDEVIHGVAVTEGGQLWVGTPHGLYEMQRNGELHPVPEVSGHVRAVYADHSGALWIATTEEGLSVRQVNGKFVRPVGMDERMNQTIRVFTQSSNGEIWAGTTAGLIRMSPSGMNLYPISTVAGADFGSIFIDSKNDVWLSAGSLTRFKNGREFAVQLPIRRRVPIRAYFEDSDGATWIGTLGDGCYRIQRGQIQHFNSEQLIRGFLEGPGGEIWIATDAGMARWRNGRFQSFRDSSPMMSGAVRAMTLDSDGSVWVGTAEGLYKIQNGRIIDPELAHLLRHQRIWALHEGRGNMLWIGAESGLYIWRQGRLTHLSFDNEQAQAQPVLSILEDARDRILLAQPREILRLERKDLVDALSGASHMPDSSIYETKVGTPPELFEVAKETGAELYGTIPVSAQADSHGGAWYASYLGLVHIGPGSIQHDFSPPPLVIKQIDVDGIIVQADQSLNLPSSARTVQIRATPILLSSRPGLWVRSRLIGFESSWTTQTTTVVSSYNELPPGRYTYRVEAGWEGSPDSSSIELQIVKEGPYYRRPWFLFTLAAFIGLAAWLSVLAVYRFKVHQIRLHFRAVSTERNRVAREIHDTLLQGCIAVYSLLETYLSIRAPDHQEQAEDQEFYLLEHARAQIVETIADARTSIWNVRHAETGASLNQVLSELLSRTVSSGEIDKTLDDRGEVVMLPPDAQYEVMMAARESILNAISHGDPKHITVKLRKQSSGQLTVQILDDGRGFDPRSRDLPSARHFGLAGLRERITALGGNCEIESAPGKGTSVSISLPAQVFKFKPSLDELLP